MNTIKWELEDLAFATLYPKRYDEIVRLVVRARAASATSSCSEVIEAGPGRPARGQDQAPTVTGRPKHYYSIYQKMIVRGRDFDDIYDLVGIRVLVDTVRDCYAALGTIHARWNPVPGRFKDYIAMPKFNMYQSLHTTVIGPERQAGRAADPHLRHAPPRRVRRRRALEVQGERSTASGQRRQARRQRTKADAATWPGCGSCSTGRRRPRTRASSSTRCASTCPAPRSSSSRPRATSSRCRTGATPVDFAYAVHTEVGHRSIGARVNGRLVPLESHAGQRRHGGDLHLQVAGRRPVSRDWLTFVKSPRARNKIRQWFSKERREDAIEEGKDAIARAMRKQGLPLQRLITGDTLAALASDLRYPDVSALYAAVGEGHVSRPVRRAASWSSRSAARRAPTRTSPRPPSADQGAAAAPPAGRRPGRRRQGRRRRLGQAGPLLHPGARRRRSSASSPAATASRCTAPTASTWSHLAQRSPSAWSRSSWAPSDASVFLVAIQVEALDRSRLLSDVTRVLSDQHVNILSASVTTTRDRVAISRFTFEMGDPKHLGHVLKAVRSVEGVYDVYRVTN